MDIVLQSGTDISQAEIVFVYGRNVCAGAIMEGVLPCGKRAVFIGAAADDDAFESSFLEGLWKAFALCVKQGCKTAAVDVPSFTAKDRQEDYLANVVLDALADRPAAANGLTLYVMLELKSRNEFIADKLMAAMMIHDVRRVNCSLRIDARRNEDRDVWTSEDRERIGQELDAHLRKAPKKSSFREELLALIELGGFRKFSEVYKRAGISKSTFSKIVNFTLDYMPSKPTVAALAIGLGLDLEKAQDLFHAAGYHLGETDMQDRIVRFFLEQRCYDIHEVNCSLDRYGLPVLGEHAREAGVRSERR